MKNNVLIISASPKGKKGNSESLADFLAKELFKNNVESIKVSLRNEMRKPDTLVERINTSEMIVLSFPVYENAVSGLIQEFFEVMLINKDKIRACQRKMLVISNSGFPEPEASECAISQCKLFSEEMNFIWAGGITVAPGTLIDGKELEKTGGTYKRVIEVLRIAAKKISMDQEITSKELMLTSRPLMPPFVYRTAGRIIQRGAAKKIGKEKYFAMPFK
jgi:multimeric flavodoxin WrbA